ncbi:bestrophin-3-like [Gordionus sp. m RMFG-2023]|uniref:bestrophin-3-like n=1 Tax=Gordionus sp. m RMFG-2023 TaxID=3053472 RepID=UPI0031FE2D50
MEVGENAEKLLGVVPLAFILGFYTDTVLRRWWRFYISIPYPDRLAFLISTHIHGTEERPRIIRRTLMRYINLTFINVFRSLAISTKKRFPTLDHLVASGILIENEKKILQTFAPGDVWCVTLLWSIALISKARSEGYIRNQFSTIGLIKEIMKLRGNLGGLLGQDWISIPLIYTQVVMMAVYSFCILCLFGRQTFLIPGGSESDIDDDTPVKITQNIKDYSAPLRTLLHYAIYIGWIKAAEVCLNPMGEDDDDFPINWLIDRNLYVSYILIDEMHQVCPPLVKDNFWDKELPQLPYNQATKRFKIFQPFEGSAAKLMETITIKPDILKLPENAASEKERILNMESNLAGQEKEDLKTPKKLSEDDSLFRFPTDKTGSEKS